MIKPVDEPMQRLRDAFRTVLEERMKRDFENGVYDGVLQQFIEGKIDPVEDQIEVDLRLSMVPNDILVFRVLAGFPQDKEVTERVRRMWREEGEGVWVKK